MAKKTGNGNSGNCPLCGAPSTLENRPFCSKRCKQLDLGKWLNESYRVPAQEEEEFSEDDDDRGFDA